MHKGFPQPEVWKKAKRIFQLPRFMAKKEVLQLFSLPVDKRTNFLQMGLFTPKKTIWIGHIVDV